MARNPRYLDLANSLRKQIAQGRLTVGDQLPTEHELCDRHDLSRHTARAALQVLEDQGLIERRPGLGTRVISSVARPAFTQPLGGLDDLLQYAHEARLSITSAAPVVLSASEAARLGAEKSTKWLKLDGVRRISDQPIAATTIYVAAAIGARPIDLKKPDRAITEHIEEKFGARVASISQRISSELLNKRDAAALGVPPGGTILRTIRRYFDTSNRLYVISDSRHPGDRFSYEMSFRRSPPI